MNLNKSCPWTYNVYDDIVLTNDRHFPLLSKLITGKKWGRF